jgi:hypothetical protein
MSIAGGRHAGSMSVGCAWVGPIRCASSRRRTPLAEVGDPMHEIEVLVRPARAIRLCARDYPAAARD